MKHLLFVVIFFLSHPLFSEEISGVLILDAIKAKNSAYQEQSSVSILYDHTNVSLTERFDLKIERRVLVKFFKESGFNQSLNEHIFYLSKKSDQYKNLKLIVYFLDSNARSVSQKETQGFNYGNSMSTLLNLKPSAGQVLEVSYTLELPYSQKFFTFRTQSNFPIDNFLLQVDLPDLINYDIENQDARPITEKGKKYTKQTKFGDDADQFNFNSNRIEYSNILPYHLESFDPCPKSNFSFLLLSLKTLKRKIGQKSPELILPSGEDAVVDYFSKRADFLGKLNSEFNLPKDYQTKIGQISSKNEKVRRIFDLVRRNFKWNEKDTISINLTKPLNRIWDERKANSTEINMLLVKVLQQNGIDATPMVVSTASNGKLSKRYFTYQDFNRTVAFVKLDGEQIVLDATTRFGDYPIKSGAINNMTGIIIGMDKNRWFEIEEKKVKYKENVLYLGNLLDNRNMRVAAYVTSEGYAKAEKVEKLVNDSIRNFKKFYFQKSNLVKNFNHFITANEFVDSLPLNQEFDFLIPMSENGKLYSCKTDWFFIPDTLFTISENGQHVHFNYPMQFSFQAKMGLNAHFDVHLLPSNSNLSWFDGGVEFSRESSRSSNSFSIKSVLNITQTDFSREQVIELSKALKKIKSYIEQEVILEKID